MPFGGRGGGGGRAKSRACTRPLLPGSGYIVYCITNTSRAGREWSCTCTRDWGGWEGGEKKTDYELYNCSNIVYFMCAGHGKYMYMKLKEIYYFSVCISIICYDRSHCCYELTYIYVKNRVLYTCMYPAAVLYYAFLPSHKV